MNAIQKLVGHMTEGLGSRRLRVRRVNEGERFVLGAIRRAVAGDGTGYAGGHGGGVANKYGYPAQTEAIGVVALIEDGILTVAVGAGRLPANKVTITGAVGLAGRGGWRLLPQGRTPRVRPGAQDFAGGALVMSGPYRRAEDGAVLWEPVGEGQVAVSLR